MPTHLVTGLALLVAGALAACGDDKSPPPLGSACDTTQECDGAGTCLQGLCLAPDGDQDGDTLPNSVEADIGTFVVKADSDDDGINDRDEVTTDLKPKDGDGDGVQDALESDIVDDDGDCVSNQRDPDDTPRDTLLASVCKRVGVCAGATFDVSCADPKAPACNYDAVAGYEADEASCDERDNDCDGETDEGLPDCHGEVVLLELAPAGPLALEVGASSAVTIAAHYEDESSVDVTATATWESNAPAVASVSAGTISALGAGAATITARFGGLSVDIAVSVTVREPVLEAIAIADATTPLGVPVSFVAIGRYDDGAELALTGVSWSSSNPAAATIDGEGEVSTVGVGTTIIRARRDGVEGSATLTVTAAEPVSVDVLLTSETPRVPFEGSTQLRAFAMLTDGNEADYSTRVTWRSSDETRATVDDTGLVTGRGIGPVDITAELEGVLSTVRLEAVVALVPLMVRHDVRATRLGTTTTTIVARPPIRVEHAP